jgi:hypothetical protein
MIKYNKVKVLKLQVQHDTLKKIDSYGVNVHSSSEMQ